ncbi:MAG: histidine kinase [Chloroflexota bacterium]
MDTQSLVPLVAAVIYLSLLIVFVFNRRWQQQHWLFAGYLAAAALWSFGTFLLRSNFLLEYKLLLFRALILASVWWIVQLYYFVRVFLNQSPGLGVMFGYAFLAISGVLAAVGFWPLRLTFSNGEVIPIWGWYGLLYAAAIVIYPGLGLYSLIRKFVTLAEPEERNRVAYLIVPIVLLVIFGFMGITPLADKFPISHVGNLFAACIFTYAIMKHELVSLNSILRRGLGWVSLFVLGSGIYLSIVFLANLLFSLETRLVTLVVAALSAAVVAAFIYWLHPKFLGVIDQLFYRGTYSYRQALISFSSKMGNIINLSELADEILPSVAETLQIPRARLLFEDRNVGDFTTQFVYPKEEIKARTELRFSSDNPIITWLEKGAGPLHIKQIDTIPQLKGLWQVERDRLIAADLELLCPIKSRGKLIGILALSKKKSDVHYSQEDIELIMSLANQAGIIIENARMLDSLKKQQLQVEQLLAELVHAQEEERQRISVDLHDSVAQWLAGASYRAQTVSALLAGNGNQQIRDELTTMESTIDKSLKELRRVLIGLRPPALDELGLSHALRQSLEVLKTDGLDCRFTEVGKSARLPSSVEIAVYRIVQEALNNIRWHAGATKVDARLQFQPDRLLVEIRDNGQGFDLAETLSSAVSVGHIGLLGMKQRAEMLGGELRIKTSEGAGTNIILSLPILPEEEIE